MMASNKFKINRYNWFCQKLITQHRYDELLEIRRYISGDDATLQLFFDQEAHTLDEAPNAQLGPVGDHMNYLAGLALMKTRKVPFDELINIIQRLNYQKNGQYFLLLCQCLLYIGNYDSVVAICKQVFNREIDTSNGASERADPPDANSKEPEDEASADSDNRESHSSQTTRQQNWSLKSICEESLEFKNMVDSVNRNCLINDPRLWFIFALCLELQSQFKDADLAYRLASKLASGQAKQMLAAVDLVPEERTLGDSADSSACSVAISNYNAPHIRYAEFCIRYRDDYKTATQVLNQVSSLRTSPVNYDLNPVLALALCAQPNSNATLFVKAKEIIQTLDNHSASNRNPAFGYNQIALRCKQKLYNIDSNLKGTVHEDYAPQRTGDEKRMGLGYTLIKSFILINDIVQNSLNEPMLFNCPITDAAPGTKTSSDCNRVQSHIDKAIETLRNCHPSYWQSHSLWNNLGVCYLMKRRYVASLSCLIKALQLNPLDWRTNYNLALVYLHVDVIVRALCCSLASKSFHHDVPKIKCHPSGGFMPSSSLMDTMLASCYFKLDLKSEARRYYAEMMALGRKGGAGRAPVFAIVNYLLLLYQMCGAKNSADDQDSRLIIRLLDQLEQDWLQRNPNEIQFIPSHLEIARKIGDAQHESRPQMRKSYAWTKYQ